MSEEESLVPAEWYAIAERDLGACKVLLKAEDIFLPVAGALLQQAVEKYLKGYLISKGWALRHIHHLDRLLADLIKYESDFAEFTAACVKISEYYTEQRYSLRSSSKLARAEVEQSLTEAETLITRIKGRPSPSPESQV